MNIFQDWPEPIVRVQSLSESNLQAIPNRYVKPLSQRPNLPSKNHHNKHNPHTAAIPIIDLGGLYTNNITLQAKTLDEISKACREWGFFQVVNHGMSPQLMDRTKETWREFFNLPMELKNTHANSPKTYEGYGSRLGVEKGAILDWSDYYYLHYQPLSLKDYTKWPSMPLHCRDILEEYCKEMVKLLQNAFGGKEEAGGCLRVNYYPICPQPELTLGLSPHSDPGGLTILLPDEHVAGLQVRGSDDAWITVQPAPHALIVNIGDQIQMLSNSVYKSIEHRVIVNPAKERLSLAFFYNPKGNVPIEPLKELVTVDSPALYTSTTYDQYRQFILANIGVFWNMDDSPIPDGLDPTSVLEFIKLAFENFGYLEETELVGVLGDLKLLNYNILVASVGEDASGDLVCLSARLFGGGKPVDQSISSHGVSNKLAHVANTGVFWNLDDCEIPDHIDIYQNVKSALVNQGCHGQVSIWAYCEEDKEPLPGITFVSTGDAAARFKKMLRDILFWALQNPVHRPRTTVPSLMVISNISRNIEVASVLQLLVSRDYNVLLTVPDEKEYICSVWLYPRLIESLTEFPICTRSDKSLHDIKTGIFWNITGCTFPNDIHLDELNQNIKLAIENQGHHGEVGLYNWLHGTITLQTRVSNGRYMKVDTMFVDILLWALDNPAPSNLMVISNTISHETELSSLLQDLESKGYNILVAHAEEAASPVLPPACLEWRLDTLFAGGNPINRTNYSRDVLNMIQNDLSFRRKGCHDTEGNTGIFWSIEDCPIPSGLDPLTFFFDVKKVLPGRNVSVMAYCNQNRSLDDFSLNDNLHITLVHTADKYARIKKMFKDIFLWALENPESNVMVITKSIPFNISDVIHEAFSSRNYNLVLADPHGVAYVNSVWLSTSLFGGGDPIDPSGRKNLPSSKEVMTKWKITS
ncbi:hypothetical protein Bca52824_008391 [Brassica carinata]|uniref:Fe2OG dioxygenase domain-containing protein n=2 Tax=Brassica carinata TaxID=52824 RepID=A0A8X7WBW3_BRACI|nr:hypothetical protein Bca52824_008391 [Brassica carinata]